MNCKSLLALIQLNTFKDKSMFNLKQYSPKHCVTVLCLFVLFGQEESSSISKNNFKHALSPSQMSLGPMKAATFRVLLIDGFVFRGSSNH